MMAPSDCQVSKTETDFNYFIEGEVCAVDLSQGEDCIACQHEGRGANCRWSSRALHHGHHQQ